MNRTIEIQIAGENDGSVEKLSDELMEIIDKYLDGVRNDLCEAQAEVRKDKSLTEQRIYFGKKLPVNKMWDKLNLMGGLSGENKEKIRKLYESEHQELPKQEKTEE